MKHTYHSFLRHSQIILYFFVQLSFWCSCTKADIHYPSGPSDGEGYVTILPDMSTHVLPTQNYHFYAVDNQAPSVESYFCRDCDGSGNFRGFLPAGIYRVIAAHSDVSGLGVSYRDLTNHEVASVYALDVLTSTRSVVALPGDTRSESLGNIYSTVVDELVVTAGDTVCHTPLPTLLTKTVRLTFTLRDGLQDQVSELSGYLRGVYPSVRLFTCLPAVQDVNVTTYGAIPYAASLSAGEWKATCTLLGLYDPEHGSAYRNQLSVSLVTDNGILNREVDLTGVLSDIIDWNEGVIPIEIPIELVIEALTPEVIIRVKPWNEGGWGTGFP